MLPSPRKALAGAILLVSTVFAVLAHAQSSRFDELANAPFTNGFLFMPYMFRTGSPHS